MEKAAAAAASAEEELEEVGKSIVKTREEYKGIEEQALKVRSCAREEEQGLCRGRAEASGHEGEDAHAQAESVSPCVQRLAAWRRG